MFLFTEFSELLQADSPNRANIAETVIAVDVLSVLKLWSPGRAEISEKVLFLVLSQIASK